jgi:hypothetical protein
MLAALPGILSAVGGFIGTNKTNKANRRINAQNIQLQKQFAQQGIQWRVADAKAAGIHPLAALGAQTHSFAPQSIGMDYRQYGQMGQDIGRAMQTAAGASEAKRLAMYNEKVRQLNLKNMELQNGMLASQIAKNTQAGQVPRTGVGSHMLVDGQTNSGSAPAGLVIDDPQRRTVSNPERLWETPASVPDVSWARTKGGHTRIPSTDVKRAIEDMLPLEIEWYIRNKVLPMFQSGSHPPVKLKKGHQWRINPFTGNYYQSPRKRPWHYYRK